MYVYTQYIRVYIYIWIHGKYIGYLMGCNMEKMEQWNIWKIYGIFNTINISEI